MRTQGIWKKHIAYTYGCIIDLLISHMKLMSFYYITIGNISIQLETLYFNEKDL